jgi:hypothetical protein
MAESELDDRAAVAATSPPYKMPPVSLGPILWRYAPGAQPQIAFVTEIGQCTVNCVMFPPEGRVGVIKTGVRHSSDPALKRVLQHEGCWDYTELEKKVREFLDGDPAFAK